MFFVIIISCSSSWFVLPFLPIIIFYMIFPAVQQLSLLYPSCLFVKFHSTDSSMPFVFFPTFVFCFHPAPYLFVPACLSVIIFHLCLTIPLSHLLFSSNFITPRFPSVFLLCMHVVFTLCLYSRNSTVVNSRAVTNHQCCCKMMPSAICRHIKSCLTFTFFFRGKDNQTLMPNLKIVIVHLPPL